MEHSRIIDIATKLRSSLRPTQDKIGYSILSLIIQDPEGSITLTAINQILGEHKATYHSFTQAMQRVKSMFDQHEISFEHEKSFRITDDAIPKKKRKSI